MLMIFWEARVISGPSQPACTARAQTPPHPPSHHPHRDLLNDRRPRGDTGGVVDSLVDPELGLCGNGCSLSIQDITVSFYESFPKAAFQAGESKAQRNPAQGHMDLAVARLSGLPSLRATLLGTQ